MPRTDNNRSVVIPYRPGMPPAPSTTTSEIVRAVWDELQRVAQSLSDLDAPMSTAVYCAEQVTISKYPAVVWDRLFDEGVFEEWSNPALAFDSATGVYTFQQEGVYQIIIRMSAPAFPQPASKFYYAGLRMTIDWVDAAKPNEEFASYSGGEDSIPLTIVAPVMYNFSKGDKVWFDGALDHESKTGTADVKAGLQLVRLSGTGNNALG